MFNPPPRTGTLPNRWITLSLAAHILVITAFLIHRTPILKATALPGDPTGHYLLLTYTPGHGSARAVPQVAKPAPSKLPALPASSIAPAPPSQHRPEATTAPDNTPGTDTFGQGDIKIASVLNHPSPHPDLNQLPAGTHGDVIVDIVIDPAGHIASYTLNRGLNPAIDQTVLATIQQWTFQPATRNGVPITSEQELLFHYERG